MHVISSFESSAYLELAILALEQNGVDHERIAAVPMEPITEKPGLLDAVQRADGIDAFDAAAILGTVCSVLGASFGFQLKWGPILWGLIGLAAGAFLGFVLSRIDGKTTSKQSDNRKASVVLIVQCEKSESISVIRILKEFLATSIGTLENP